LAERNIAVVARRQAALAIEFPVGNRHRQHRPPGNQRRLEQRGMEMQQTAAIGGRPLGKHGNVLPLAQHIGDLLIDDFGVAAAAPAQENRVVLGRQPADQRPVPDFLLRNESGRQGGVDHVDIDPRDMVGDQQSARHRMGQIGLDLDAERVEQGGRPALLEPQPATIATERKNNQRYQRPGQHQQGDAKNPEGASRKVGVVQASCPR